LNISLQSLRETKKENSLKAVLLAGGFGTRLRPLSCGRPKILFPIVNKPLLQWTFERLAENNIDEAILAVNYQTEIAIKQQRIPKCGLKVIYSRDPPRKPLGTGGAIKKTEKYIDNDHLFLALNGDIFADVNYSELLEEHKKRKHALATIVLRRVADPSRYGVAELTAENKIIRFIEKPPKEKAPTNLINAGVYVLSKEIFDFIPKGQKISIEYQVFPKLAKEGKLYGYIHDGLWTDIGKPEDYLEINNILLDVLDNKQDSKKRKNVEISKPVAFDRNVSIGKNCILGPYTVLGKNVVVGDRVHAKNTVILRGSVISDCVCIEGAIIGEGVYVGMNVKIGKNCIIGDHVKIKDNVTLAEGVSVCPAKEISESVSTSKFIA